MMGGGFFIIRTMHWLNIEITTFKSRQFTDADPDQQATWLKLLGYCAENENGGVIKDASKWSDRSWIMGCGVTKAEVANQCDLWSFGEDGSLTVWNYPHEKEAEVKAKRAAGRKGANLRHSKSTGYSCATSSASSSASSSATRSPSGTPCAEEEKEREVEEELEAEEEKESEQESSAPALPASPPETVPAQTLSLFSDEPALTPKPKPRKPKPPAEFQPPKDPRHHEITREIKAIYEQHARMPYVNSPRFYKRLQVFLSQWHGDSELFLSVYAKALTFADQEFASKEIRLASDPTFLCDNFQKDVAAVDWMQASIDRNSKPKTFTKGI